MKLILVLLFSLLCISSRAVQLDLTNPLDLPRASETIEIAWSDLASHLPGVTADNVVVLDEDHYILSQVIDLNADHKPDQLVFQCTIAANQTKSVRIETTGDKLHTASFVFGRAVPERKDDFAWENDRIAFRMYGPALQSDNDASSGVDVWVKSVRALVINKWYKLDDYHTDHGEGVDAYKVGKARGAGGLGIFVSDQLHISKLYTQAKILANGPIRLVFELDYAPWEIDRRATVKETKRITLDAHQNLNRFESRISTSDSRSTLAVAVGLTLREGGELKHANTWAGYWEPEQGKNGHIAVGMIVPGDAIDPFKHKQIHKVGIADKEKNEIDQDFLAIRTVKTSEPFVYYAGAGWSKSGDFPSSSDWFRYLDEHAKRIASPIQLQWR
jgi:hypothetical protein